MRGTQRSAGDDAVSPVIAVILMVAITVVLAATVYVWVSGFTDTGDQAPSANIRHVSCDVANDQVTVKLTSGGPLQTGDVRLILFNRTNDVQEAETDPLISNTDSYGSQWGTGTQQSITKTGGAEPNWDSALSSDGGLDDGTPYRIDFVHKPTESTFVSLPFSC